MVSHQLNPFSLIAMLPDCACYAPRPREADELPNLMHKTLNLTPDDPWLLIQRIQEQCNFLGGFTICFRFLARKFKQTIRAVPGDALNMVQDESLPTANVRQGDILRFQTQPIYWSAGHTVRSKVPVPSRTPRLSNTLPKILGDCTGFFTCSLDGKLCSIVSRPLRRSKRICLPHRSKHLKRYFLSKLLN